MRRSMRSMFYMVNLPIHHVVTVVNIGFHIGLTKNFMINLKLKTQNAELKTSLYLPLKFKAQCQRLKFKQNRR
jgi:hypothetical protein